MNIDQVQDAVNRFFSDRSRPASETRAALEELRDDIEVKIDSLEQDCDGD